MFVNKGTTYLLSSNFVLWPFWACVRTSANCCLALSATDAVILHSIYVYLMSITLLTVPHHRQEHIFSDFSLITFKFPDFSRFSRSVATLTLMWTGFDKEAGLEKQREPKVNGARRSRRKTNSVKSLKTILMLLQAWTSRALQKSRQLLQGLRCLGQNLQ